MQRFITFITVFDIPIVCFVSPGPTLMSSEAFNAFQAN